MKNKQRVTDVEVAQAAWQTCTTHAQKRDLAAIVRTWQQERKVDRVQVTICREERAAA